MKIATVFKWAGAAALASSFTHAFGAGFAIVEQSIPGLGTAFAGGAAQAEDPSTVYFNPAGLTRLAGRQYAAGVNVIEPSTKFADRGSTGSGNNGGDAGETGVVPNFYYTQQLKPQLAFGLGINAPFGLATEYDPNWIGRYHAIRSELKTLNINPALGYRLSPQLSLGVGVDVQHISAELSSAIDLATILGNPAVPDGRAKVTGDDWSWGYNLGLLYELSDQTRFGFAYRSKIKQKLKGQADFTVPITFPGNPFVDTNATANINLPESASLSVLHTLSPSLELMGDVSWTRWSQFQELRIHYDGGALSDTVVPEHWKDSARYALGLQYRCNGRLVLRTGIAYDETPIPSPELRTPRIPGNDRKWLAFGLGYAATKSLRLDFGYAHLFVSDTPINNTDSLGHRLTGSFESKVDIVSAQIQGSF